MSFSSVLRALVNRLSFAAASLVVLSQTALHGAGNLPSAVDGFDPNVNGNVFALATQADGKVLVGGTFTTLQPNGGTLVTRNNLARVNSDGSLDLTFNPNVSGTVSTVAVQSDGKVLVGGLFTTVGGAARSNVARLNADGSLDASFNPGANGQVNALALQADGRIIVGGNFTTLASTTRNRVARLNADGSLDKAFDPNASGVVTTVAVQVDGRILIGGGFTTLQPAGTTSAVTRNRAARLNTDGSIELGFDPGPNNLVTKIALQRDGGILLGGAFTTLQLNGSTDIPVRNHLARINADGTLDVGFDPSPNGNISTITVQADGRILLGGYFTSFHTNSTNTQVAKSFFARVNFDGTVDTTFDAGANQVVMAAVVQADGQIVAGGYFTQLLSRVTTAAIATTRNHLARVNTDGTLDITFDPNTRGGVQAILVQTDGKILIGGSFSSIGGTTRNYLARLNADSTLDLTFNPNPNGRVLAIAQQSTGQIIIGGAFSTVGGVTRNNIARLNLDGSVDVGAFDPNTNGQVNALVVQSDNKVLLGGAFTTLQSNGSTDTTGRNYLARVNADGGLDTTYNPNPNSTVLALQLQSDGKALVGGSYTIFQPNGGTAVASRNYIARVNADGSIDGFNPSASAQVTALALQSDGKVILAGAFGTLQPNGAKTATTRNRIARVNADGSLDTAFDPNATTATTTQIQSLAVQSDGKILVAGVLTYVAGYYRNNFARLNADGTLDINYDPNPANQVQVVKVQSDGKVLVGGPFTSLQPYGDTAPTARLHLARITTAGAIDPAFNPTVGGQVGGQVSALAVQSDGRIIIAGSLDNIGGATSSNLTRFTNDSTPDAAFNPNADGPINVVSVRPITVAVPTQLTGFAWLNGDGSLRSSFVAPAGFAFNGDVTAVVRQSDGKLLVASSGTNLVRFNSDGSLDSSFGASLDGAVYSIAVQSDGKIIVAGAFLNVSSTARNHVARLNADGSLDTAFDPNANAAVMSTVIQSDGKIVLAGAFTTLQPNAATASSSRNYIARVNADGTLDTTYNPTANAQVSVLALQSDGKVLAGGIFTTLQPNGASAATTRDRIARLNTDGTLDPGFNPDANSTVVALAVQTNGQVLLGGTFTTIGGTPRKYIARVAADGTVDTTFDPSADSQVSTITVQSDARIVLGGLFTTIRGQARNHVARINADGTLDTSFNPNANGGINVVSLQPDGSLVLGGTAFSAVKPNGTIYVGGAFANLGGAAISNLALLSDDGTPSNTFRPNPNGAVYGVAQQTDGRIVVAGAYTTIAGAARNRLARFGADGTLDTTFNPNANGLVSAQALQADGRILVGGAFTTIGSATRNRLARLNADGSADTFNPGADGQVSAIAVQADGKILVGGAFTSVGGASRNRLARLNADGSLDTFNPGADGQVNAIILQADGKILVGGSFTNIAGAARSRLARLNADGSVDTTFDPGPDNTVNALALQADGKLLVGGAFAQISGSNRYRFARLAATNVAAQSLALNSGVNTVTWTRGGTAPELSAVALEQSSDSVTWTSLGQASRVGTTSNWQLAGLTLSKTASFYVRARGVAAASEYGSSSVVESVRLFIPTTAAGLSDAIPDSSNVSADAVVLLSGSAASSSALSSSAVSTASSIGSSGSKAASVATSDSGTATVSLNVATAGTSTVSHLAALSARGLVGTNNPLVTGFVITGTEPKSVLLRGVGPGLAAFGVEGVLPNPQLQVYDSTGQLLFTAGRWQGTDSLAQAFASVGAFPLLLDSADAACVVTLPPGVYTVEVTDLDGASGVALVEVYDLP